MQNIIIGLVVLILLVFGGYYIMNMNGDTSTDTDTQAMGDETSNTMMGTNDTSTSGGAFSGSLVELAKRGGTYKCTFSSGTAASESSGTVYVSGQNIRGDFTSLASGMTVESHMIQTGGYVYVWSPMMPQGFKTKTTAGTAPGTAGATGQYADMNSRYDYNCTPESASASMFTLPAGVTFVGQ